MVDRQQSGRASSGRSRQLDVSISAFSEKCVLSAEQMRHLLHNFVRKRRGASRSCGVQDVIQLHNFAARAKTRGSSKQTSFVISSRSCSVVVFPVAPRVLQLHRDFRESWCSRCERRWLDVAVLPMLVMAQPPKNNPSISWVAASSARCGISARVSRERECW